MSKSKITQRALSLGIGAFVAVALAGCGPQAASYSNANAVVAAYKDGGGSCTNPEALPAFNNEYGIYGYNCSSTVSVLWFENDKAKSDWLELVSGSGKPYVLGPNWMVMTSNLDSVTSSMGGTPSS
jgi:hypothetical protein